MIRSQIYNEHDKIYQADTCQPLIQAYQTGKIHMEAWGRFNYPGHRMDDSTLAGINSIGYWDAHFHQEWGLDWHRNEGIEITLLETGTMPFFLGDSQYTIMPDELTITRPWQPHKVGNPAIGVGKLHWLIIDVSVRQPHQEWVWPPWIMLKKNDLEELTRMLRQNEQPTWKANVEIRKCFQRIGQLLKDDQENTNESWITLYINEILLHLLDLFRQGKIKLSETLIEGSRTVEFFIKELQKSFVEPWTLESMAAHCGLGTTRFAHYFKQLINSTPMQYLTLVRLENAAKQLRENPQMNIKYVCYDCGFSSSEYFSTVFRKQFGCSPTTYRLLNISKN